ncbi:MAG: nicotinate-nicotinamide nucleotide adenylyltransferase [Deltaproteobacteria bacterium]|nr:nicotinate-nicotinamide nucleotide adenylyltransferase [Deltaproteobacteria bacterium]MBW2070387.1 nicotinate-nicotinamide nucleotide adenylyltransferase [Deltaproteobacteria bacterium]
MTNSSTVNPPDKSRTSPILDFTVRAVHGISPGTRAGRLGIIGGSYNPITRAHLVLSESARDQAKLHEVLLVLSKTPPHKVIFGASLPQRLEMMRLAVEEYPFISIGLCSHGLFLDICSALKQVYPAGTEFFFITGRDAAERILSWPYHDPAAALEQMFSSFQLLVFPRQGPLVLPQEQLLQRCAERIHQLRTPAAISHISSSLVRQYVREGKPFRHLVPEKVHDYIIAHQLYRNANE